MEPRYFWLKSDGKTVKEISFEEYRKIVKTEWTWTSNTRMICRLTDSEIYVRKGQNYFWIPMRQLKEVLGA